MQYLACVTRLCLANSKWASATFVLIAAMCPQLRVLRLESSDIDDDGMLALLLRLPQLEELHLAYVVGARLSVAGLQPMLQMPVPVPASESVSAASAAPVPLQRLRYFCVTSSRTGYDAADMEFFESFAAALYGGALPALQDWRFNRGRHSADKANKDHLSKLMRSCITQRSCLMLRLVAS